MISDGRLELVMRMSEQMSSTGSTELLFQYLADDVVWRVTAPAGTELHERFIGREGVAEYFRRVGELLSIERISATDYLQAGDKVVVLGTERLRAKQTGREEELDWVMVMSFVHDRITEILVIEDLSLLLPGAAAG